MSETTITLGKRIKELVRKGFNFAQTHAGYLLLSFLHG